MAAALLPTTHEIGTIAAEELSCAGGTVTDCFDDGNRLFLRSTLPMVRKVRPGDPVRGGVAVMTVGEEIRVHPYTYREVCRNGAVMARAIETRRVERVGLDAPSVAIDAVTEGLREAVRACSAPEAFSGAADRMTSATQRQADLALHLFPMLSRVPEPYVARLLAEIEERFAEEGDRSMFGLINAVTSVARDEPDPGVRWRLEELGGGIVALVPPTARPGGVAADPSACEVSEDAVFSAPARPVAPVLPDAAEGDSGGGAPRGKRFAGVGSDVR